MSSLRGAIKKIKHGAQVHVAVMCEGLAVPGARHNEQLFVWVLRPGRQAFRESRRHPDVCSPRNE